jgi:hypothetical protein
MAMTEEKMSTENPGVVAPPAFRPQEVKVPGGVLIANTAMQKFLMERIDAHYHEMHTALRRIEMLSNGSVQEVIALLARDALKG